MTSRDPGSRFAIIVVVLALSPLIAGADQDRGESARSGPADLNGMWQGPYTPNLAAAYGKELPFTAHGAEKWAKVDTANDPTGFCLPVGPARGIQAPFPFQIV